MMEERWSYVCNGTLEGQEKFAQRFLDEAVVREQPAGTYLVPPGRSCGLPVSAVGRRGGKQRDTGGRQEEDQYAVHRNEPAGCFMPGRGGLHGESALPYQGKNRQSPPAGGPGPGRRRCCCRWQCARPTRCRACTGSCGNRCFCLRRNIY